MPLHFAPPLLEEAEQMLRPDCRPSHWPAAMLLKTGSR